MEKNAFQDLVFTAAEATSKEVPKTCSLVHFETVQKCYSVYEKMVYTVPISKVLWCTDVKSGCVIDWTADIHDGNKKKSIKHSKSFGSGLCEIFDDCNTSQQQADTEAYSDSSSVTSILPLLDDTLQYVSKYRKTYEQHLNSVEVIGWKATLEAEILATMPRDISTAITINHQPQIITKKVVNEKYVCNDEELKEEKMMIETSTHTENRRSHLSSSRVYHVNECWEKLCGYAQNEVVDKSLEVLQGEETDPDVLHAFNQAIHNEYDVSVLIKNYKKNGECFMNRLRVVPIQSRPCSPISTMPSPPQQSIKDNTASSGNSSAIANNISDTYSEHANAHHRKNIDDDNDMSVNLVAVSDNSDDSRNGSNNTIVTHKKKPHTLFLATLTQVDGVTMKTMVTKNDGMKA